MAKAKAKDITSMSADELNKRLAELRKEQLNLRFQRSTGQLENTAAFRMARREVARIKTLLNAQNDDKASSTAQKPAAAKKARVTSNKTTKTSKKTTK